MEMNMDMDMLLLIDIDRDMYTCTYICKHVCMCVCLSPGLRPKRKQVIICDALQLRFTFYTESPELPTRIASTDALQELTGKDMLQKKRERLRKV